MCYGSHLLCTENAKKVAKKKVLTFYFINAIKDNFRVSTLATGRELTLNQIRPFQGRGSGKPNFPRSDEWNSGVKAFVTASFFRLLFQVDNHFNYAKPLKHIFLALVGALVKKFIF